ncbi:MULTISPECIES: hypothetical protein [Flavobacterium]|uniref:Uncharacterized protein n=1 Tax=Flavobacterium sedimenticola TaxID=3043286 RepID=A0ABT6XPZ6_9FLAO|nr:hypothetical protein [Flavobacterium sedimenticola]MDI9257151.1 hypothetical protein [Flavobacterium sedimenticola]
MEINWVIIGIVVVFGLGLVAYLIRQNQKDQEKVNRHFNSDFPSNLEEEDELNNDR